MAALIVPDEADAPCRQPSVPTLAWPLQHSIVICKSSNLGWGVQGAIAVEDLVTPIRIGAVWRSLLPLVTILT